MDVGKRWKSTVQGYCRQKWSHLMTKKVCFWCVVEKGGLRELFRDIIIILQANMLFVCASLWNITKYVHKTLSCSCCFLSAYTKVLRYCPCVSMPIPYLIWCGSLSTSSDTKHSWYTISFLKHPRCNTIHTFTTSHTCTHSPGLFSNPSFISNARNLNWKLN